MDAVAAPGQGITDAELALATRNRGMPLEALRYDLTPPGLHYLLIHFDIPEADADSWVLEVDGEVARPLRLTLPELRSRPAVTVPVTLECAGNGRALLDPRPVSQPWLLEAIGTAEWTGTPLAPLLEEAGLDPAVVEVVFTGADHGIQGDVEQDYQRSLPVAEARRPEVLLAYAMNGRELEPQHGYPLRLVVPGWYGMASVKWLQRITAVMEPFTGYQQVGSYRLKQSADEEIGDPVTRIQARALMIPPGIPDFLTRRRVVDAGPVELRGRAWSGQAPVTRVEVAVDGTWHDADLQPAVGDWAWRQWSWRWQAMPGQHVLACRATDAAGNSQPLEQPWNVQGMCNNRVQEVAVTVR